VRELFGRKQEKIYKALVDGAYEGFVDDSLYRHVLNRVPDAKRKTVVKAAMAAMRDIAIEDPDVLETMLRFAIRLRISRKRPMASSSNQAKVV
jgi:hypothetical protein